MIHVVGNAAVDTVIRVDRFPQPGQTIVARSVVEDLGGKGANQAIVMARCGQDVRLIAAVGADAAGDRIQKNLVAEGVQTDGIRTWPGATDRSVIYVDNGGENTIVSLIDAAAKFDPIAEKSMERDVAPGDWMTLQGNLRPSVTMACLALAKRRGATTALNPSPVYPAADYDWNFVDLVVLNRGEAVALGVRSDPLEAAHALLAVGAKVVVLTLGAEGAIFLSARDTLHVQAPRVPAADSTGAGDVFCAVIVAARAAGRAWTEALTLATRASAICVSRAGTLASFPTREELDVIFRPELLRSQELE